MLIAPPCRDDTAGDFFDRTNIPTYQYIICEIGGSMEKMGEKFGW